MHAEGASPARHEDAFASLAITDDRSSLVIMSVVMPGVPKVTGSFKSSIGSQLKNIKDDMV